MKVQTHNTFGLVKDPHKYYASFRNTENTHLMYSFQNEDTKLTYISQTYFVPSG